MQYPPPLTLPPAVCPGAPMKKGKNPDYVPIGNSVRKNLFPKDDGYETPDDQPTRRTKPPKLEKKRQKRR